MLVDPGGVDPVPDPTLKRKSGLGSDPRKTEKRIPIAELLLHRGNL